MTRLGVLASRPKNPVRTLIVVLVVAAAALVIPSLASAATITWKGTTNTDWGTASNWSPATLPTSTDNVVIDNTSSNDPAVTSGTCTTSTTCEANQVTLVSGKTLTVTSGFLKVSAGITAPSGSNITVNGGTLSFGTLTVDNSTDLTLTSGTIDGTLAANAATTLTNAGVNYGASGSGGVSLGSNVTLTQTANVGLQGTLAIGSDTFNLDGKSISVTSATPEITLGSGTFNNEGGAVTDTVAPEFLMDSSSGTVQDQSASGGSLVFTNSATSASANQYEGTIDETGSGSSIILGNSTGVGNDGGGSLGGSLTVDDLSHSRSDTSSRVEMVTNGTGNFDLGDGAVTMNGDLTLDSSGSGTFSGGGTFQSGSCLPSDCTGDLLIHDAQFASSQTITIPSGTRADVENEAATWNNQFTFDVNGTLLLDQSITTNAAPASAPTIDIGSTGVMNHEGGSAVQVEPIVASTGTIQDDSSSGGLSLANPIGINTDTLRGLLQTLNSNASIQLGHTSDPTVFQLSGALTTDTFSDGGTIETAGTTPDLELSGNTLTIDGTFTHGAGTISGNGTIAGPGTVDTDTTASPGSLALDGGNLAPGSSMSISAPIDQSSAGSEDTTLGGTGGALTVSSTWSTDHNIDYTGTSGTSLTITSTGALDSSGDTTSVEAPLTVNGALTDDGSGTWTIDSTNGATCTPTASCVTTVGTGATVTDSSGTLEFVKLTNVGGTNTLTNGTWVVDNGGTLQLPTAGTAGIETLDAPLTINDSGSVEDTGSHPGLVNLETIGSAGTPAGSLSLENGTSNELTALEDVDGSLLVDGTSSLDNSNGSGTTTIDSTGTAEIDGQLNGNNLSQPANATVDSGGLLKGTGTITGNLTNDGTVHTGDSPGTLTVSGNYTQGSGGTLNIEVSGTSSGDYGVLHVVGNETLGGTVNMEPTTTYAASAATNDTIPFNVYLGTLSGTFATVTSTPPLANGRTFTIDYSQPGTVKAVVGPASAAAPTNTGLPAISGPNDVVGSQLMTTNGTWTGSPTFTYQWYDCNASGSGCTAATGPGATTNSYTLVASDVGHTIRVMVFGTSSGVTVGALSNPTATVTAPTSPPVKPKPKVSGQSLSSKSFKASSGTKLKLKLSAAATVKVVINLNGHKVNGACKAVKNGKKCTKKVKTLSFSGVAGSNTFKIKTKGLKKGSYTLVFTARNSGGTSSKKSLSFKIT